MKSERKTTENSSFGKITTALKKKKYPIKSKRHLFSTRQDCYTESEVGLMKQIQGAYQKLSSDNQGKYFDTTEESHWYGIWTCITPFFTDTLRKHEGQPFALPNPDVQDPKIFPLWEHADKMARKIANWQSERADGQDIHLVNDPVMLAFEELRDWFFKILTKKECNKETLAMLTKRQSYVKSLTHIVPDFGKDQLLLREIQKGLEEATQISISHIANRELPQFLSGAIVETNKLEITLGTLLHFLFGNEKVDDNFSLACLDSDDHTCAESPIKKIYTAAQQSSTTSQTTITGTLESNQLARVQELNSLVKLYSQPTENGALIVQPMLRKNLVDSVKFADFVTPTDKEKYLQALAVLETLTNFRKTLEKFRHVQTSIGTYFFASSFLDKTNELAHNYNMLVTKANRLFADIIQTSDNGFTKTIAENQKYKNENAYFLKNLKTLDMYFSSDTTNLALLDKQCSDAIKNMNLYKNHMESLARDVQSGKASEQVQRAMNELLGQINELNMMLTAVAENKEFLMKPEKRLLCDDSSSTDCDEKKLLANGEEPQEQPAITTQNTENEIPAESTPTLEERMIDSAITSSAYGALRGVGNVVENRLEKSGYSRNTASFASQLIFYSGYFTSRLYHHHQIQDDFDHNTSFMNNLYQSAWDTGQLWVIGTVINSVSHALDYVGNTLQKNKWQGTGSLLKKMGSATRYGLFAATAINQGIPETATSLVMGSGAEYVTERIGNRLLG